jgi:hypothetical protein
MRKKIYKDEIIASKAGGAEIHEGKTMAQLPLYDQWAGTQGSVQ